MSLDSVLARHSKLSQIFYQRSINQNNLQFLLNSLETHIATRSTQNQENNPDNPSSPSSPSSSGGPSVERLHKDEMIYLRDRNAILTARISELERQQVIYIYIYI